MISEAFLIIFVFCFLVRKPKTEKTKPDKEAQPEAEPKKKKGFLPETKKRKKVNKTVLEPASKNQPGEEKSQAKKKRDKKQKRPADGANAPQPSPAKKSKTQNDSKPGKKKKKKKPKQKKGEK